MNKGKTLKIKLQSKKPLIILCFPAVLATLLSLYSGTASCKLLILYLLRRKTDNGVHQICLRLLTPVTCGCENTKFPFVVTHLLCPSLCIHTQANQALNKLLDCKICPQSEPSHPANQFCRQGRAQRLNTHFHNWDWIWIGDYCCCCCCRVYLLNLSHANVIKKNEPSWEAEPLWTARVEAGKTVQKCPFHPGEVHSEVADALILFICFHSSLLQISTCK